MSDKLAEMWAVLEAYQPTADADEHGKSWRVMCRERTNDAAWMAHLAAPEGSAAAEASSAASLAAEEAAAKEAAWADEYAQEAIDAINRRDQVGGEVVSNKFDEMWAAFEAHEPLPTYAREWAVMLKERTWKSVMAVYILTPEGSTVQAATLLIPPAIYAVEMSLAEEADCHAQCAIAWIKAE